MTATEELRHLLDERGVKYTVIPEDMYGSREYIKIGSTEIRTNGLDEIAVFFLTPEQAVEATLGRETCHLVRHGSLTDWPEMVCWSCSVCNFGWHRSVNDKQFNYCPNCGRKVMVN